MVRSLRKLKVLYKNNVNISIRDSETIDIIKWFFLFISVGISYLYDIPVASIVILIFSLFGDIKQNRMMFPLIFFFYTYLNLPFVSLSVFIPYSIIYILKVLLLENPKFKFREVIFILLNLVYCISVMVPINIIKAISGFLGVLFVIFFFNSIDSEKEYKNIIKIYVVSAIFAGILSFLAGANMTDYINSGNSATKVFRFLSTFSDPNYASLFYSVGFWGCITLKPFSKTVNLIVDMILVVFILFTMSISGIIALVASAGVYFMISSDKKLFHLMKYVLVAVFAAVFVYYLGKNYDIPYISDLIDRIDNKLMAFFDGNINAVTTNRTNLLDVSMNYFFNETTFFQKLFGGICTTAIIAVYSVIHNEYMTLLFNMGILGTIIYALCILPNLFYDIRMHKSKEHSWGLLCKFNILFYAMTLTMLMDFRFLFIFMI